MKPALLVADRELDESILLADYFNTQGFEVLIAANGTDVIHKLSMRHFEVCILDFNLPGQSVHDIVASALSQDCGTRFIIMSNDASFETERTVRTLSPDFYFVKPFKFSDLSAVVDRILRKECMVKR